MLSIERRNIILSRLKKDKNVLVGNLSAEFSVSEETIRRDLERLEREGHATRTYGGAILCEDVRTEQPFTVRKQTNVEAKQAIAAKVAQLINDGDFIMLDESTTASFVARAIKDKKNLTVITNSIEIIIELAGLEGWNILSTGGALKSNVLALTGYQAESRIREYHVDKAIISCTGLDLERGYTDAGEDNALIKRAMMQSSSETILAADAQKFGKKAFASIGLIGELSALVTDAPPDEKWKTILKENGVDLIY
jgi:DeoR/GlpR family transcriptional regulator of sugar metabolism